MRLRNDFRQRMDAIKEVDEKMSARAVIEECLSDHLPEIEARYPALKKAARSAT